MRKRLRQEYIREMKQIRLEYYIMYFVSILPECIQVRKVKACLSMHFKNWLYYNLTCSFFIQDFQKIFKI